MSTTEGDYLATKSAAVAIASTMGTDCYALVGGAACTMLGSQRITLDVDFVVPKGQIISARRKFVNDPAFKVDARTRHTQYIQGDVNIDIDILAPPRMFRGQFDESTPCIVVDGVKILKPTLILDAKCLSIFERSSEGKKQTDAFDIKFLLSYIIDSGMSVGSEVPNASSAFIIEFVDVYGGRELFKGAGFSVPEGILSIPFSCTSFSMYYQVIVWEHLVFRLLTCMTVQIVLDVLLDITLDDWLNDWLNLYLHRLKGSSRLYKA